MLDHTYVMVNNKTWTDVYEGKQNAIILDLRVKLDKNEKVTLVNEEKRNFAGNYMQITKIVKDRSHGCVTFA